MSLTSFRDDVTSSSSFNVPESSVRPLGTLHLTLGVMSFPGEEGDERLGRAVRVLKELSLREMLIEARRKVRERLGGVEALVDPIVEKGRREEEKDGAAPSGGAVKGDDEEELRISLKGLGSFQSLKKAKVLYALPVDPLGLLRTFCEDILGIFRKDGFVADDGEAALVLHATVVNTIYVKKGRSVEEASRAAVAAAVATTGAGEREVTEDKKRKRRKNRGRSVTVDAREIAEKYEDWVWMEDVPLGKIQICEMGAKERENGEVEYEAVGEVLW